MRGKNNEKRMLGGQRRTNFFWGGHFFRNDRFRVVLNLCKRLGSDETGRTLELWIFKKI